MLLKRYRGSPREEIYREKATSGRGGRGRERRAITVTRYTPREIARYGAIILHVGDISRDKSAVLRGIPMKEEEERARART